MDLFIFLLNRIVYQVQSKKLLANFLQAASALRDPRGACS